MDIGIVQTLVQKLGIVGLSALTLGPVPARADNDDCAEPMATWQPREVVAKMALDHGWTVHRIKIDDGCYRLDARNREGRRVQIWVNPATLLIRAIITDED